MGQLLGRRKLSASFGRLATIPKVPALQRSRRWTLAPLGHHRRLLVCVEMWRKRWHACNAHLGARLSFETLLVLRIARASRVRVPDKANVKRKKPRNGAARDRSQRQVRFRSNEQVGNEPERIAPSAVGGFRCHLHEAAYVKRALPAQTLLLPGLRPARFLSCVQPSRVYAVTHVRLSAGSRSEGLGAQDHEEARLPLEPGSEVSNTLDTSRAVLKKRRRVGACGSRVAHCKRPRGHEGSPSSAEGLPGPGATHCTPGRRSARSVAGALVYAGEALVPWPKQTTLGHRYSASGRDGLQLADAGATITKTSPAGL